MERVFLCECYLMAQLMKNPSVMQETWVHSLGWEDPLEEGTVTHSGILAPHGQRSLVGCSLWGCRELDTTERLSTQHNWKWDTF